MFLLFVGELWKEWIQIMFINFTSNLMKINVPNTIALKACSWD